MDNYFIRADWPAPAHISAMTTCRSHGHSDAPYNSWNLADHVSDEKQHVEQNRALLKQRLKLPDEPAWLQQVHGDRVISIQDTPLPDNEADGSYTQRINTICCVMTADCLPVLITNREGTEVAAVHAGWRGLAAGVVESALEKFTSPRQEILVWLGPAIGPTVFEVGEEVRAAFLEHDPGAEQAFRPEKSNKLLADIYQLARQRLHMAGISSVFGGQYCTYTDEERFFSFRRNPITGRMASLIWIHD